MKSKNRVEALCSFFVVGFGQILKGEGEKGLRLMLIFYFVLPAAVYVALMLNAYLFLIALAAALVCGIGIWGYNIWDAYKS